MQNTWNKQNLLKPPVTPKTKKSDISSPRKSDLDELTHRLAYLKRAFERNTFSSELDTFFRLLYKNKNQQKSSKYFKRLLLVSRLLKRLRGIGMDALVNETLNSLYSKGFTKKETGDWECLPSKEYLLFVMTRIVGYSALIDFIKPVIIEVYEMLREQLAQTLFMPVNLTFVANIAKIYKLLSDLRLNESVEFYKLLRIMYMCTLKPSDEIPPLSIDDVLQGNHSTDLNEEISNLKSECNQDISEIIELSRIGNESIPPKSQDSSKKRPTKDSEHKSSPVKKPKNKHSKKEIKSKSNTPGTTNEIDDIFGML